jgi:3-oxoacyl-[acyl-carrier-protein] synthase-3
LRSSGRLKRGDRVLVLGAEATQYLYGGFVYVHG